MTRQCQACSNSFEAKRDSAKYCGGTCRKRAQRTSPTRPDATPDTTNEPSIDGPAVDEGLIDATRAALEEAGAVDTVNGQLALLLARDLAHSRYGAGSHASLAGRLQLVMADALAGHKAKTQTATPVDNIRGRSARKRASAAGIFVVPDVG